MGQLIYRSDAGTEVSIYVNEDSTTIDFIEDGVAPLMYGMGYFPTNVAEALNLEDHLSIYKNYGLLEGVYDGES